MRKKSELRRLISNCRLEMGPEVFRQFKDDLAGQKPAKRTGRLTCALCGGVGRNSFKTGPCEGCGGSGKF